MITLSSMVREVFGIDQMLWRQNQISSCLSSDGYVVNTPAKASVQVDPRVFFQLMSFTHKSFRRMYLSVYGWWNRHRTRPSKWDHYQTHSLTFLHFYRFYRVAIRITYAGASVYADSDKTLAMSSLRTRTLSSSDFQALMNGTGGVVLGYFGSIE